MIRVNRTQLEEVLADLGFEPEGGRIYRATDCRLFIGAQWWCLRRKTRGDVNWLARRGLWKLADDDGVDECCDLPVGEMGLEPEDLAELLTWVLADSQHDGAGDSNDPRGLPQIEASRLTARAGAKVCQGVVQSTPPHLRVEFHLGTPALDLPTERRAWLHTMCKAAHNDRMVRVTTHPETGEVYASVDLSGCPAAVRDGLLNRAVDHLRAVVEGLLPVISFLNDPSVASRALCSDALSLTAMENVR